MKCLSLWWWVWTRAPWEGSPHPSIPPLHPGIEGSEALFSGEVPEARCVIEVHSVTTGFPGEMPVWPLPLYRPLGNLAHFPSTAACAGWYTCQGTRVDFFNSDQECLRPACWRFMVRGGELGLLCCTCFYSEDLEQDESASNHIRAPRLLDCRVERNLRDHRAQNMHPAFVCSSIPLHCPSQQPRATCGSEHLKWGQSPLRCAVSVKYMLDFKDSVKKGAWIHSFITILLHAEMISGLHWNEYNISLKLIAPASFLLFFFLLENSKLDLRLTFLLGGAGNKDQ